jgi:hypothetical protein
VKALIHHGADWHLAERDFAEEKPCSTKAQKMNRIGQRNTVNSANSRLGPSRPEKWQPNYDNFFLASGTA